LQSALWASDTFLDDIACHGGLALLEAETQTAITFKIPIEDVPLGARVPTKNPRPWEYDDSLPEPDEANWAKISLTIERTDGGVVDAELIRPRVWVESYDLQPGTTLSMHIEELKIDGTAFITAIDPCPVIAPGEGSVVTARFMTRQVDEVATVTILGPDGETETLTGTTIHPIWSVDRQDWVELAELQEGETLQAATGLATVLSVKVLNRSTPVYNFEVHGEHVYQVGELGLLVHNAPLGCVAVGKAGEALAGVTAAKTGIKSVLNPGRWRFPDDLSIPGILKEVKNVKYQGLTSQIRDYIEIAKTTGRTMELWVRTGTGTTLSKNLLDAEASGKLIINRVL
jgi:Restriction endonuclease fold toxin 7/Pretoxin HINT domain